MEDTQLKETSNEPVQSTEEITWGDVFRSSEGSGQFGNDAKNLVSAINNRAADPNSFDKEVGKMRDNLSKMSEAEKLDYLKTVISEKRTSSSGNQFAVQAILNNKDNPERTHRRNDDDSAKFVDVNLIIRDEKGVNQIDVFDPANGDGKDWDKYEDLVDRTAGTKSAHLEIINDTTLGPQVKEAIQNANLPELEKLYESPKAQAIFGKHIEENQNNPNIDPEVAHLTNKYIQAMNGDKAAAQEFVSSGLAQLSHNYATMNEVEYAKGLAMVEGKYDVKPQGGK